MSKPVLLVIGGCNGSGKSTYSRLLVSSAFTPFDYDLHFLRFYKNLLDTDFRETMAHNMASRELETQINFAISKRHNFCYETNFNSTPLHWPYLFKQNDYELSMIYFCMNSIDEAKRRVTIRVQNGGHFVPEDEIRKRYHEGFSNLNSNFRFFDNIHLFDSSTFLEPPKHLLSIQKGQTTRLTEFPDYLTQLIPDIAIILKQ